MSGEALQIANHNHQYSQKNKVLTHLYAQPSSGGDPDGQTFFEKKNLNNISTCTAVKRRR